MQKQQVLREACTNANEIFYYRIFNSRRIVNTQLKAFAFFGVGTYSRVPFQEFRLLP